MRGPRSPAFFRAGVLSAEALSPSLRRIVLGGTGLTGWFPGSGVPDEAVQLFLPAPGEPLPAVPQDDSGSWPRPGAAPGLEGRWYTVRRCDERRGALTVDVVVHGSGAGADWAARVRKGDHVGVSRPHHWYRPPENARWQVLVGDLTALPAVGRILEQTPERLPTRSFLEVPGPADEQVLPGPPVWTHNPSPHLGSTLAGTAIDVTLPTGPGYVWVAGEAAATRAIRRHLRHGLGLAPASYTVITHWRPRAGEWSRRFASAGIDLAAIYRAGTAAGHDGEQISDEVDRRLDDAGL
ncbi:siderophore-interacting protein [Nocardiopsis ansamitocini]|uniref:Siderophore-interacting protein n=1 Tax=Nocardiopsis ansamitocini TaxID=1670832 RepID=A0A9W6P3C4_9ACTN|nr:siderophore-interacting protein [Nocardiopsis ansamitocini]GLU46514.1 siderophore-interacting protein [Nocardiopsis ansamitocini]